VSDVDEMAKRKHKVTLTDDVERRWKLAETPRQRLRDTILGKKKPPTPSIRRATEGRRAGSQNLSKSDELQSAPVPGACYPVPDIHRSHTHLNPAGV
jgi:hypothetical protein